MLSREELIQVAYYEKPEKLPDENIMTYIRKRFSARSGKYCREERVTLAITQLGIQCENVAELEEAKIDDETLFQMEALMAAFDYQYTFNEDEINSPACKKMLAQRYKFISLFKELLAAKDILQGKPPKRPDKHDPLITTIINDLRTEFLKANKT